MLDCNLELKVSEIVWEIFEELVINVDYFVEMFVKVGRKIEGKFFFFRCMYRIK